MADSGLARERQVAHLELAHFLNVDVPEAQRRATALMEEAVLDFRGVRVERTASGEASLVNSTSMVFLESEERTLVASLRLTECHVQDFDLNIRLPKYNKGQALSFSLMSKSPYLLRQIQDAVHHTEQAASHLAELTFLCPDTEAGGGSPLRGGSLEGERERSARHVVAVCEKTVACLRAARHELEDWSSRALPLLPQNTLRMYPPLPADLRLQAYVDGASICLRVSVVVEHVKQPSNKPKASAGDSCHNLKGRIIPHKSGWVEFVEACEARTCSKTFQAALNSLNLAYQRVWDLQNNAEAILAILPGAAPLSLLSVEQPVAA